MSMRFALLLAATAWLAPSADTAPQPAGDLPTTLVATEAPQAIGMLPSLVELASAAGDFQALRTACRQHGDTTTFAATLVAEQRAASKRVI